MKEKKGRSIDMKVTWLGQAGLLFDFDGVTVMVDPYLSNSVAKIVPKNQRRKPVEERFFEVKPDILVLTHNHLDHTDPETLERLFSLHSGICVLASANAWSKVLKYGGENNYICFGRGTVWHEKGIRFEAVRAEHSDESAIGVVLSYQDRHYYITGDTLYQEEIFADLSRLSYEIDAVFLPINGVGNNMNMTDAALFAQRTGARKVVPLHFGMFDGIDPESFVCERRVIPKIYEEIDL